MATWDGLPLTYWTDTWHLPSGRRNGEGAVLARLRRRFHDPVRKADRRGHEARGLGAGIAEHHALVPGAHLVMQARAVDALRDVG